MFALRVGFFSNVKCFRCLCFSGCVADINVHICSNFGSEKDLPFFRKSLPVLCLVAMAFVCKSCTGA